MSNATSKLSSRLPNSNSSKIRRIFIKAIEKRVSEPQSNPFITKPLTIANTKSLISRNSNQVIQPQRRKLVVKKNTKERNKNAKNSTQLSTPVECAKSVSQLPTSTTKIYKNGQLWNHENKKSVAEVKGEYQTETVKNAKDSTQLSITVEYAKSASQTSTTKSNAIDSSNMNTFEKFKPYQMNQFSKYLKPGKFKKGRLCKPRNKKSEAEVRGEDQTEANKNAKGPTQFSITGEHAKSASQTSTTKSNAVDSSNMNSCEKFKPYQMNQFSKYLKPRKFKKGKLCKPRNKKSEAEARGEDQTEDKNAKKSTQMSIALQTEYPQLPEEIEGEYHDKALTEKKNISNSEELSYTKTTIRKRLTSLIWFRQKSNNNDNLKESRKGPTRSIFYYFKSKPINNAQSNINMDPTSSQNVVFDNHQPTPIELEKTETEQQNAPKTHKAEHAKSQGLNTQKHFEEINQNKSLSDTYPFWNKVQNILRPKRTKLKLYNISEEVEYEEQERETNNNTEKDKLTTADFIPFFDHTHVSIKAFKDEKKNLDIRESYRSINWNNKKQDDATPSTSSLEEFYVSLSNRVKEQEELEKFKQINKPKQVHRHRQIKIVKSTSTSRPIKASRVRTNVN